MRTIDISLGQMVALARSEAGLSQQALADELGMHKNSIANWERGRADPTPHLREIEAVTGKPPGWISDHVDPYTKVSEMAVDISLIRQDVRDILGILRQTPKRR